MALFDGPDYDSAVTFSGDGLGMVYDNWDKNSIQLCECDNGFFSSDCSQCTFPPDFLATEFLILLFARQ